MESVTLTRKQRMVKESEKNAKDRKRRIQRYAFVGTVATGIILGANSGTVFGCNSTYTVQKGDSLYSLAKKYNVSVEQLQEVNLLSSEMIKAGQILEVPTLVGTHSEGEQQNNTNNEENNTYTVQRGDSLHSLAKKYNVSVEQLQEVNLLSSEMIKAGQMLEVPTLVGTHSEGEQQHNTNNGENNTYTVQPGDSLYSLAKKYGVTIDQIQQGNGLTSEKIKVAQVLKITSPKVVNATKQAKEIHNEKITFATYTVAAGETLSGIARQFNLSIADLKRYNNMSSDMILIGQKLIINPSNLMKTTATVVGSADNFSVEFIINGEPTILKVAYGTAPNFEKISGQKVELVYSNANQPRVVSFKIAEAQLQNDVVL